MTAEELNELSRRALKAAFQVHVVLGPGLLESSYEACLAYQLRKAGLKVELQVNLPVVYDGQKLLEVGYRLDMIVEDEMILEIKATDGISPVHRA